MKVNMKVKHFIYMLSGIIILTILTTFVIQPQVSLFVAKMKIERGDVTGKEDIVTILERSLLSFQKWNIIQDYMLDEGFSNQFNVIVGPSFSQENDLHANVRFSTNEKIPYLEDYVQNGPINGYLTTAAKQLASYYYEEGYSEKAYHILTETAKRLPVNDSWDRNELLLERIKIATHQGEYTKADQYIKKMIAENKHTDDIYFLAQLTELKAKNIAMQGNIELALEEINNALERYKSLDNESFVYEQLTALKKHLTKAKQSNSNTNVRGKITRSDGTPVENVGVFLRDERIVTQSVSDEEMYRQVTDEEGYFEFSNVVPGSYQVFLGFTFDQIDGWMWPVDTDDWIDVDGKNNVNYDITLQELINVSSPVNQVAITDDHITFAWEKVPEASYYTIDLGVDIIDGSISTQFKSYITNNQITVSVDELYAHHISIVSSSHEELDSFDPKSILAFTNTENRLFWAVEAYDASGEKISSSRGHRLTEQTIGKLPFFYLKERTMTDADRLLLEKNIYEALVAYKKNYKDDPDDIHSLRMISRLIGYEANEENKEKLIIPYLIDLAEKNAASIQDVSMLYHYYYDEQEWELFHKWFTLYLDMTEMHMNEYDQAIYASALMKQGKLEEAREQFHEVMKRDKRNEYVGYWLATELYLSNHFNHIMEIAQQYPERRYGEKPHDWEKLMEQLRKEETQFTNYQEELKKILNLFFQDNEEALNSWLTSTKKQAMKEFIKAIRDVE